MDDFRNRRYADVAKRFINDIKDHKIKTTLNVDLHRRYRCRNPKSGNMWFDVITWPGCLCINGDMGTFVFSRTDDMLTFMSTATQDISYSAEKCIAGTKEEECWEIVEEWLKDRNAIANHEKIQMILREHESYGNVHDGLRALYESGLCNADGMPNTKVYTYQFLWCIRAIKWLCDEVLNEPKKTQEVKSDQEDTSASTENC